MLIFSTLLGTIQGYAAMISLAATLGVVTVVVFLITTSSVDEDKYEAKHHVYAKQKGYAIGLATVIAVALGLTLQWLPYSSSHAASGHGQPVTVVGTQWAWRIAPGDHSKEEPRKVKGKDEITLPLGQPIDFIVTSADVNHNFAIYDGDGVLLTQTQAMPSYYNVLSYTFSKKGDYTGLCLEYCGAPHVTMKSTIHVE